MAGYDEEIDYGAVRECLVFDGKRMRQKAVYRKTVDPNAPIAVLRQDRIVNRDERDRAALEPHSGFTKWLLPPMAYLSNPVSSVASKFIHSSINKQRSAVNCLTWSQGGRRCVTGSTSGEFTLWNGLSFNFETILQAHDVPVRSMQWTHNENWMVTGDQMGNIKYWQPNMNNVKAFVGHKEAVRDIKFSRTDQKMVTCSDDVTVKVWDFATCQEEAALSGHGWDVKCVDWHPTNSLIVSGSKDSLVKLWDAKSKQLVATLHGHKSTVVDVEFNRNGNWLLTSARDQLAKLFDIRMMKEVRMFRGHKRELTTSAWHPIHEDFFVTAGFDGAILFWSANDSAPLFEMIGAHDQSIWGLSWHPVGHVLASCSNDQCTKFWSRQRPGDAMDPRYHIADAYRNHYEPDKPDMVMRQAVPVFPPSLVKNKEEKTFAPSKISAGLVGDNHDSSIVLPGIGPEGIIKASSLLSASQSMPFFASSNPYMSAPPSMPSNYPPPSYQRGGDEPPAKRARTDTFPIPRPGPSAPQPYSYPMQPPSQPQFPSQGGNFQNTSDPFRSAQSFNQPPPNFNQPPPNFNQPPPNFNQPPPSFNQPPPNMSRPPPNYPPRYGQGQ